MKYKAIIFDMDGTIIDSENAWKEGTKILIENHGVQYTPDLHNEINKYVVGAGIFNACKTIKEITKIEETIENLIHKKKIIVSDLLHKNLKFITGFEKFHDDLTIKGLRSAIASNADDNTMRIAKQKMNLERFFGEHIYNVSHVENVKPHPDLYLHAADKLKTEPDYCVAIEDSAVGIEAAKRAGMFCIGINTAKNIDSLKNADLIIDDYHQINLNELLKKV